MAKPRFKVDVLTASIPSRDGAVTVGVAATKVLSNNDRRLSAILVNDSVNTVFLSFNQTPALNSGIRLNANGGTIILGSNTDIPFSGEVWAIAAAASVLTVVEFSADADL